MYYLFRLVGLPALTSADVLLASHLTSSASGGGGGGEKGGKSHHRMTRSSTGSIYSISTSKKREGREGGREERRGGGGGEREYCISFLIHFPLLPLFHSSYFSISLPLPPLLQLLVVHYLILMMIILQG